MRQLGIKKYHTAWSRTLLLGILAGAYISLGGLLSSMLAGGFPEWAAGNPILPKLLAGASFPIGLILVVLAGADLFTGHCAYFVPGTMDGELPRTYFLRNWVVIYVANFIGAFLFDYFIAYSTDVMVSEPYRSYIIHVAENKVNLSWGVSFLRGIGANWLVCLAIWLGLSSKSMAGKVIGLWFPVMAFVTLGFEHSIANMFYIPTAMLYGADVTVGQFVADSLVPSTLGNIIGGGFFVGFVYWMIYRE